MPPVAFSKYFFPLVLSLILSIFNSTQYFDTNETPNTTGSYFPPSASLNTPLPSSARSASTTLNILGNNPGSQPASVQVLSPSPAPGIGSARRRIVSDSRVGTLNNRSNSPDSPLVQVQVFSPTPAPGIGSARRTIVPHGSIGTLNNRSNSPDSPPVQVQVLSPTPALGIGSARRRRVPESSVGTLIGRSNSPDLPPIQVQVLSTTPAPERRRLVPDRGIGTLNNRRNSPDSLPVQVFSSTPASGMELAHRQAGFSNDSRIVPDTRVRNRQGL